MIRSSIKFPAPGLLVSSRVRTVVIAALVGLSLSACTVGPDYQRPDIVLPATYQTGATTTNLIALAADQVADPAKLIKPDWWTLFEDPELDELMRMALVENADLLIAIARISEAIALAQQAGAPAYPSLALSGSGVRGSSGAAATPTGVQVMSNTSQVGLTAAYEFDVWGKIRRSREAANAQVTASVFNKDSVALVTAGLVSNTYLSLRSLDAQVTVMKSSIETRSKSLKIAEAKLEGGLVSPIDVNQAIAAKAASGALLADLVRRRELAQNQLAVLTGKLDLSLPAKDVRSLPIPPVPPAGLPSTLIENRPDVRQAEQDLVTANARIGVAKANFFPSFTLTASYGAQSVDFRQFLATPSNIWSMALGLAQPLFTGGLLQGKLDYANAVQQEILAVYVKTLRTSFRDVSDALVGVRQNLLAENELTVQVGASGKAQDLAMLRYEAGYVDYLTVLEAQRSFNDASLAYVINRAARLQSSVDLFKALGGGWQPQ